MKLPVLWQSQYIIDQNIYTYMFIMIYTGYDSIAMHDCEVSVMYVPAVSTLKKLESLYYKLFLK